MGAHDLTLAKPDVRGGDRAQTLLWLPLVVLTIVASCYAAGLSAPVAHGDATSSVTVDGFVIKEMHISTSCDSNSLTIPNLTPGDPARESTSDCSVVFGSGNSLQGADLYVSDATAGTDPGMDAMTCVSPSCGTAVIPDVSGSPPAAFNGSNGGFAARLRTVTAPAAAVWTQNTSGLSGAAPLQWYDIQDAPEIACQTNIFGDGTCGFRFAASADPSPLQPPGNYQATVLFESIAR